MTHPRVLVLQHIACETPAVFEAVLREREIPLDRVELDEGERADLDRGYAAVVVMGGPMGVNDVDQHRWLDPETALVAEAARRGVPVWGVCLGAQILAAALGARVSTGRVPEVGIADVDLTEAARHDEVFGTLPSSFPSFHWHSDTFDLPEGAVLLASSAAYAHQAFRVGPHYAVQFHLEVTAESVASWADVPAYLASLEAAHGPGALGDLLADTARHAATTERLARDLFGRWLDLHVPTSVATR